MGWLLFCDRCVMPVEIATWQRPGDAQTHDEEDIQRPADFHI